MSQKLDNVSVVGRFFSSKIKASSPEEVPPAVKELEHETFASEEKRVKEPEPVKRTKRNKAGRKASPLLGPKSGRVAAVNFKVSTDTRRKWKIKAAKYGISIEELVFLAVDCYKGENLSSLTDRDSSDISEDE